ncbi:hypothetical protein [Novacetimonas pomaceti]|nr:hypothetical protein [Novacetimonas pomaceti]
MRGAIRGGPPVHAPRHGRRAASRDAEAGFSCVATLITPSG